MPVHGPPAKITAYEAREEALKTTWVNPNYPSVPSPLPKLDVPFFTSADVDPNGQVGLNPDGTWSYAKLYNWSTWKRPIIEKVESQQLFSDRGVQVTWNVIAGDVFRSGFLVLIQENTVPTDKGTTAILVRHCNEYNNGTSDNRLKYHKVSHTVSDNPLISSAIDDENLSVIIDSNLFDYNGLGGHSLDNDGDLPNGSVPNPTFNGKFFDGSLDHVTFSLAIAGIDVTVQEEFKDLGISVIPVDGRQFDSVDTDIDDISNYTLSLIHNGASYGSYLEGKKVDNQNVGSLLDANQPGGILRIFNNFGNLEIDEITATSFVTEPQYKYRYYFMISNPYYYWIQISDPNIGAIAEPYYPDDTEYNDPSSAGDNTSEDLANSNTPPFNRWLLVHGFRQTVAGLTQNTSYTVFLAPWQEDDVNRWQGFGQNDGPPKGVGLFSTNDVTTDAQPVPAPTILTGVGESSINANNSQMDMVWSFSGNFVDDCDYIAEYTIKDSEESEFDPNWTVISETAFFNKVNWKTTNTTKEGSFSLGQLLKTGDSIRVRIRAKTSGNNYSAWSEQEDFTAN